MGRAHREHQYFVMSTEVILIIMPYRPKDMMSVCYTVFGYGTKLIIRNFCLSQVGSNDLYICSIRSFHQGKMLRNKSSAENENIDFKYRPT